MHSIRVKLTIFTVCGIMIATTIVTVIGVAAIRSIGNRNADQMLSLLCETGERNLDFYFDSVEQSAQLMAAYVESDLDGLSHDQLLAHLERTKEIFARVASRNNVILTYYYRIDPMVSDVLGYWFVNLDGEGFKEHVATDITLYDTDDTTHLVWFTVPKATGKPVWQPPYITDNLDVKVISYNIPIYYEERFVGVIGIEIDYSTMAGLVDNIKLFEHGYAFLDDADGMIIYHPHIDVEELAASHPMVPDGLIDDGPMVRYAYEGIEKKAAWLPLHNGMRLNVSVPVSEINALWERWILQISVASLVLVIIFVYVTMRLSKRITKPLEELTAAAAHVEAGDYDFELNYGGNDEVGILTKAFKSLAMTLKSYIGNLKNLAYADPLTSVRNKGAFDIYVDNLQLLIDLDDEPLELAICVFDCNNLKTINDLYGHEKGDIYLKSSCAVICKLFSHSPVFRTGGDEFAAILMNQDYANREELIERFRQTCCDIQNNAADPWKKVDVAIGGATYDPEVDSSLQDVINRADMRMYDNKRAMKAARKAIA